jgi:phage repressor protein C with HTH and peptisase S24 domain
MTVSAPLQTRIGRYAVLEAEFAPVGLRSIGILLEDPETNRLHLRLRRDFDSLSEDEDAEVFRALGADLAAKASELGAAGLFEYLESTLSGSLRITDREQTLVDDFDRTLNRLYRQHVESRVLEFRTHLPLYTLRAAAGRFLDNEEIVAEGWVEAPENMQALYPDMFVATVAGHSMEPVIPDGSLCVFRAGVTGSRVNRLVLAEDRAASAYAVKRYKSEKVSGEEGWRHGRIRLESLNPDYPSWDLDPDEDKYRILAEFVRVLD